MLKRFLSIFTISLILSGSFFSIYSFDYPVYADSTTDEWMNVTTNEQLVEAFRYYCKSRDLTIEGSIADGVTSFTTQTFNSLCNTLGIDETALQAHLKYETDGNLGLRFLFDREGISLYNRIFAQWLQDNELEVGDQVDDKVVYDGVYVDGYLLTLTSFNGISSNPSVFQLGSVYLYSNSHLVSVYNGGATLSYGNSTLTFFDKSLWGFEGIFVGAYSSSSIPILKSENSSFGFGVPAYCSLSKNVNSNIIYYSVVGQFYTTGNKLTSACVNYGEYTPIEEQQPCNIYITTNNTTINNNNYEGDTIINNNGDTNNYPDNPDDPDDPDDPTQDPPTIPDSGGWQDFSLPEMPNDWLIYGMEKKFPFDIPFNIMFALSLLNHEPEIPKFEGDIDLKVCTWHYDIDLTPFDDLATILRKFEVLAFIIGLAILTKNLINWG